MRFDLFVIENPHAAGKWGAVTFADNHCNLLSDAPPMEFSRRIPVSLKRIFVFEDKPSKDKTQAMLKIKIPMLRDKDGWLGMWVSDTMRKGAVVPYSNDSGEQWYGAGEGATTENMEKFSIRADAALKDPANIQLVDFWGRMK